MPYKNRQDMLENRRLKRRVERDAFYEALGLRVIKDGEWLVCDFCHKETRRSSAKVYSHELDCIWRPVALRLLNNPRTYWDRRKVETRYLCGCDYKDPRIQEYGVTVHSDGTMTKKRYDRQGFEVCPIHGMRLRGWYSEQERAPKPKPRTSGPMGTPGTEDRRDLRDPQEVGEAYLQRDAAENGRARALEEPISIVETTDPSRGEASD
jgi:hypothetical protein